MKYKSLILFSAVLLFVSCGKEQQATTTDSEEHVEVVSTTVLKPREIERVISLSTNLQGYLTQNVAPSITGRIEHIYCEVGDRIKEGEMLVRMDQTQYNTSKLTYGNLEIEYSRMKALRESGSVSQQQYDQIKLQYDQTAENLDFLQKNTFVKAPFSGVISAKNYEDGELYGGQPILVLTQINKLKALVSIPETYFPRIKEGMRLEVTSEIYPDKVFPAVVEIVYPTVNASSHTFDVKVVIPNSSELLRPGMFVTTTIGLGKENAIVVPYQTVEKLVGANDRYVFINEDGRARRVAVTLGQRFDQDVEVIAPELSEGVEMVTKGQHKLVDGAKLRVVD